MTNKDRILKITDRNKDKRFAKILSCIRGKYEIQEFKEAYDVRNIILPAKNQENKITIMAHHDVYPGSLGYNDNSTGVITLLKLQNEVLPDNVEIVFTDGEEFGGRGSSLYLSESVKPRLAINVDVVGLGDTIFYEKYGNGSVKVDGSRMTYYKHIPFSDSHILKLHNVPNVLLLTGYSRDNLIRDIFEHQHCGPKDHHINDIKEDILDRVYDMVLDIVRKNS